MRIIVDKLPVNVKDCVFSKQNSDGTYRCTLRPEVYDRSTIVIRSCDDTQKCPYFLMQTIKEG